MGLEKQQEGECQLLPIGQCLVGPDEERKTVVWEEDDLALGMGNESSEENRWVVEN